MRPRPPPVPGRLPPLPLTDAKGREFAYACPYCLTVGSLPGIFCDTPEEAREAVARASLHDATSCGECSTCHAFDPHHVQRGTECPTCAGKRAASRQPGIRVTCPDCSGRGEVPCTLDDGTEGRAECPRCDGDCSLWQASEEAKEAEG